MTAAVRALPNFRVLVTTSSETARAWWADGDWTHLVPVLRAWAHRHTPRYTGITSDDVEDIAAKVIVRAWQSAQVPAHPSAWVRLVATNAARDLCKRALHPTRVVPDALETMPAHDTADALLASEEAAHEAAVRARHVQRAVAALPPRYRDVVRLFWLEDLGHRDVARRLGITEGCSRIRIVRAKSLLTHALAR
jgi:RNA polymerase sigma factor CnrH